MKVFFLLLLVLLILACGGAPRERYPSRASFGVWSGGVSWEVYLAQGLTPPERVLVEESVRDHLSALAPYMSHKPAWGRARPVIRVTSTRTAFVAGLVRSAQQGAIGPGEEVTVVPGYKLTCPALLTSCLRLRWDDPWGQSPNANYLAASAAQARVVSALEATR